MRCGWAGDLARGDLLNRNAFLNGVAFTLF